MSRWSKFHKVLYVTISTIWIISVIIMSVLSGDLLASFVTLLLAIGMCIILYCFIGMLDCREKIKDGESKLN